MNTHDRMGLRGEVIIKSIDKDGIETILLQDDNLIVTSGRTELATNLVTSSQVYITNVVFGSGGTLPSDPTSALPVYPSETAVITPITATIEEDYTFVVDMTQTPKVSFGINIPTTPTNLNGKSINEMALMLNTVGTSKAFAIKRFATITKSSAVALTVTWSIYL